MKPRIIPSIFQGEKLFSARWFKSYFQIVIGTRLLGPRFGVITVVAFVQTSFYVDILHYFYGSKPLAEGETNHFYGAESAGDVSSRGICKQDRPQRFYRGTGGL